MQPVRTTIDRSDGQTDMAPALTTDVRPVFLKAGPPALNGLDIPAALRKRPLVMIATLFGCLLIGGVYILRRQAPQYHAESTIYISPTYFKNTQDDREQLQISYSTLVNQQILTIRRFDILNEALNRLEEQGINWRKPYETKNAAIERLADSLEVQHIADSYEIVVGLNGERRDWIAPIVNTVTDTYLEMGKGDDASDRSGRLAALMAEQANIEAGLQQKLDQQAGLSRALMVANLDKAAPADDELLTAARQAQEEARRKRIEAETQLSMMEDEKSGSAKNALTAMAEESVRNDAGIGNLTNSLLQKRLDLRARMESMRIEGYLPEHPRMKAIEKELSEVNDQLTRVPQGMVDQTSSHLLSKLRSDVERSRSFEARLGQEVQTQASRVQSVAREVQQARGLSDEIDRIRKHQNVIGGRIEELTMQGDTPGFLRVFARAQVPLEPTKNEYKKPFMVLFGLAALLSLIVPVGMDLINQTILLPSDINRVLGFPPVGIVMEHDPQTRDFAEEHFSRLINGIERAILVQGAKSIVLTPLKQARTPGSLVADIGRYLVARGVNTVIVDANPRRGERSCVSLKAMLVRLEELNTDYDVILIDGPAAQFSADVELLSAIGDITLLVVEAGDATRHDLAQRARLLERIGVPSMGVILSQVRLRHAGATLKNDFKRFSASSWSATARVRMWKQ